MREIKFRAWDRLCNCMRKVVAISWMYKDIQPHYQLLDTHASGVCYHLSRTQEDIELMQFTGLKDKNDKEIYEGDIIKRYGGSQQIMGYSYIHFNKHTGCWGTVAWNHNFTPFYTYCVHDTSDSGGMVCGKVLDLKNYEVIGSIHENKELLNDQ